MSRKGENIRKRKDGRWEGRYIKKRGPDGKAIYGSIYGKTYTSVKEKLKEVSNNQKEFLKGNMLTFEEALFLWLENNKLKQKEQTYCKYLQLINTQIVPQLGYIKLSKINNVIINRFISEKSMCGRLDNKGGLSASYIQTICFIIESTLRFCEENNFSSSFTGKIIRPTKKKNTVQILSFDEQKTLEKHLFTDVDETKIGMLLSLYTGLRVGEVCGLRWGNIDFENNVIRVENTVERIKNLDKLDTSSKTILILSDTKTESSNRIIPIPTVLIQLLKSRKQDDNFNQSGILILLSF